MTNKKFLLKDKRKKSEKIKRKTHIKRDPDFPLLEDENNLLLFKSLEIVAHEAINSQKIFLLIGGFDVIRKCLVERGWIEKYLDINNSQLTEKLISESVECTDKTKLIYAHLVKNSPIYFSWTPKHFSHNFPNISVPLRNRINRIRTLDFSNKDGLHNIAENIQWSTVENLSQLNYPRSYLLMNTFQRDFFLSEFRRTSITSFLFFLNNCVNLNILFSKEGIVPVDLIYNSIDRIEHLIRVKQHLSFDIEKSNEALMTTLAQQIDLVLRQQKKIRFPEYVSNFPTEKLKTKIKIAVAEIHVHWPDSKYDLDYNMW